MSKTTSFRRLPWGAALISLIVLTGAAPSPVARAFGGLIVSTYPDGRTGQLRLAADGGYSARGRRGDLSSGHWTVKGDKLCLKQAKPWAPPFGFCTPLPNADLKGSWTAKAVTGETIRVRLVKGRSADGETPASGSRQN